MGGSSKKVESKQSFGKLLLDSARGLCYNGFRAGSAPAILRGEDGRILVCFVPEGLPKYGCVCLREAQTRVPITYCYRCGAMSSTIFKLLWV